jgi:hypothetical protein
MQFDVGLMNTLETAVTAGLTPHCGVLLSTVFSANIASYLAVSTLHVSHP